MLTYFSLMPMLNVNGKCGIMVAVSMAFIAQTYEKCYEECKLIMYEVIVVAEGFIHVCVHSYSASGACDWI